MANAYVSLDVFKGSGVLNIVGSGEDGRLLSLLEHSSRVVDRHCNRHFHELSAARKFDGPDGPTLLVPDLIAVEPGGLRTDEDGDGEYETTWAPSEYLLLPSNADPANASNPQSRPYNRVVPYAGDRTSWPCGRQRVSISGLWGWWGHLRRAKETANAVDASSSEVVVSGRTDVEAGHTLLVDSEQLFVRGYSDDRLKVDRGVNGTAASVHGAGSAIDVYEYPGAGRGGVDHPGGAPASRRGPRERRAVRRGPDGAAGDVPPAGAGRGRVMANEIGDAKAGLRARLETIPGLRVLDHPPEAVHELPAAVVSLHSREASRTLGGGGFEGRMRVTVLVSSASTREAYAALDRFIDPSGPQSVEAAVNGDTTWGGAVDDGRLTSVENVGARKLWGGSYVAADFVFGFGKSSG